ncbi:hypothetical protein BGW41_002890 [Actinomortierella wolfii]|nr:hypothetical protein BGW41_002890 [Actinomortierella wolfii]
MTREQGDVKEHYLQDLYERVVDEPSKSIKNILLTGGAGFTGSFLAKKLVINYPEYNVVVLDKLDYCSSLSNLAPLVGYKNFRFVRGDITDLSFVRSLLRQHEIDTILHLAAQTHVDKSFGESIEFTKNNVLGTHVLLEAAHSFVETTPSPVSSSTSTTSTTIAAAGTTTTASTTIAAGATATAAQPCSFVPVTDPLCNGDHVNETTTSATSAASAKMNGVTANFAPRPRSVSLSGSRSKIKRFIYISTDEVYGEIEQGKPPCKEDALLAPSNPYSATKAAAECMVHAYYKSFNIPIIITRSNNIYGPFQYPEKICPKFIISLLRGGNCYIHGSGQHARKYLYVADVANAIDIVLHKGVIGQVYNIGCGHEITNIDMARLLIKRLVHGKRKRNGFLVEGGRENHPKLCADKIPSPSSAQQQQQQQQEQQKQQRKEEKGTCNENANGISTSINNHIADAGQANGTASSTSYESYLDERIVFVEDRAFNDKRYDVDSTKIQQLGWAPRISFEEGIEKTIAWYEKYGQTWWGDIEKALYPHSVREDYCRDDQDELFLAHGHSL